MSSHVLKYVHGVTPIDQDEVSLNSYWADRRTHQLHKVVATTVSGPVSVASLKKLSLATGVPRMFEHDHLRQDFVQVSQPLSEKSFAWFRKLFDKRKILTLHDVETTPYLKHLYVMNGLSMESVMWHRKQVFTKVPFPIPQLAIALQNEKGRTECLKIHPSFVPVDVLQLFKASILFESNDFHNAVNNGQLYILDPAYAQSLLAQPEFVEEAERMRQVEEYVLNTVSRTITEDSVNAPASKTQAPYYKDLVTANSTKSPNPNTLSKNVQLYPGDSIEPFGEND